MTPDPELFDIEPVRWNADGLELLDQRALPNTELWVRCVTVDEVVYAIRELVVRGAPAIGIAAAYGMAVAAEAGEDLDGAAAALKAARPTAVNLAWAVDRVRGENDVLGAANRLADSEKQSCRELGANGDGLVPDGAQILTHCNAGALATGGYGSALGVVRAAVESGKHIHVWVDETRPVLQGARLTAWELTRAQIPNTLIVDGAAASLMAHGDVDLVVVGADRIAANGDVANKIGTYGVALAAAAHETPFYVAAPTSTIDLGAASGAVIEIEERDAGEVRFPAAAESQEARNPAFDVTPAHLVTAVVTESGIAREPYSESLAVLAGL